MKMQIIMTQELYDQMQTSLFPVGCSDEQFGFIVAGVNQTGQTCKLLCRKFFYADPSCLIKQSGMGVVPDPRFVQFVWLITEQGKCCLINIHTHPFSDLGVAFSCIDDRSEAESFPKEVVFLGQGPHASMVFGRNSVDARGYDATSKQIFPVNEIRVIGSSGTRTLIPTSSQRIGVDNRVVEDVHDRQVLAFGRAGQRLIQRQRVGIIGCGGIGSLLFILLVRLGVCRFVLVDHDVVEISNLNRLAGSTKIDAECKVPKVKMLCDYGLSINENIRVVLVQDSVDSPKAKQALKSCDKVFGGTDNQASRDSMNRFSIQHLIPYIDCGTGIKASPDHKILHAGGQVRIVVPGLGCLRCINGIDMDKAKMEQLPEEEKQAVVQQGYIEGADEHAPSVVSLNGVIANLAVTEFLGYVTGCKPLNRYVFYDFLKTAVLPVEFPKNPECFSCSDSTLLGSGDNETALPAEMILAATG